MSHKRNLYTGRAGQLAVMSEFLVRGYNAAIPEVDVGDDIFVVRDADGNLWRIQVKTANCNASGRDYSARFTVSLEQLEAPRTPDLTYVFATRRRERWDNFVLITRQRLHDVYVKHRGRGSRKKSKNVTLTFAYRAARATCLSQDFTQYLNNWTDWPPIAH